MRRLLWLLVSLTLLVACGDDGGTDVVAQSVDDALVPATIEPGLALYRNEDEETISAFANAGERTVMADGKIWEIRRADRLIGTVQITTVLPEIDLHESQARLTIVSQILASTPVSIYVGDVEVYSAELEDRASYVWFGEGMFEVVQLRDRQLESFESVVSAIIEHQQTQPAWVPLVDEDTDLS